MMVTPIEPGQYFKLGEKIKINRGEVNQGPNGEKLIFKQFEYKSVYGASADDDIKAYNQFILVLNNKEHQVRAHIEEDSVSIGSYKLKIYGHGDGAAGVNMLEDVKEISVQLEKASE